MELSLEQMARIRKGVEMLDGSIPNWYRSIDLGGLNLDSFKSCVIGQLYNGSFWAGLENLFYPGVGSDVAAEYGFYPHPLDKWENYDEMVELTEAKNVYWKQLIQERLS